jgi:hypothetical protein
MALTVWIAIHGAFAFVLWLNAWPDDTLLAQSVFASKMLHAHFLGITIISNLARLLLRWYCTDAILADQIRLAAVS